MDKKMKRIFLYILIWSVHFSLKADHLQVGNMSSEEGNCLSFRLSWDNSWRNAYNHDAVYLFCKYRDASSGWQALRWSSDAGQHILSAGYELKVVNGGLGVLIYKNSTGQGTSEVDVKLALAGLSGEEIKRAEFSVHGLEMVYVPTAPFYTADRILHNDREEKYPFPYPCGVRHFYAMKYELSQEQYVVFLNQLNRSAQYPRTIGGLLDGLREGDYVFGDLRTSPDHRNGIILHRRPSGSGEPYVFACNLNPGDVPGSLGDGQGVACNYLTPSDLLAYADWSGLRPLSEGEYEKMCRGNAFVLPSSGEYAWGKESAVCALSLSDESMETERAGNTDANVNAGSHLSGPSRVGMFVRPGSRPATGNSFWGISDLSGNVSELYYSRESSDFDGRVNGNGNLYNNGNCSVSSSLWPAVVSSFRLRGGSFLSDEAGLLLSSFREAADVPGGMDSRHAEVGFRLGISREVTEGEAVLTLANGLQSGATVVYDTVCDASGYTIRGDRPVGAGEGFYLWYMSTDGGSNWTFLKDKQAADLVLDHMTDSVEEMESRTFLYRRIDYSSTEIRHSGTVGIVVGYGYRFNRLVDTLQPCIQSKGIEVTTLFPSRFKWYNVSAGRALESHSGVLSSFYEPVSRDFLEGGKFLSGMYDLEVEIETAGRCVSRENVKVFVKPYTCDPFPASIEKIAYANLDSSRLIHQWTGKDPMEWKIVKSRADGFSINASTGALYGMATSLCYEIEVELKCKDYPDKIYRKRIQEYEREYSCTGNYQALNLLPGDYQLECWGADGGKGFGGSNPEGKGGYTCGNIGFTSLQTIYVYVGEFGNGTRTATAFNGGGRAYSGNGHNGGRGGGASDIRLEPGAWNDRKSLLSRIMVAAGGGGAMSDCGGGGATAGHGGGLTGGTSVNRNGRYVNNASYGGEQTKGGNYHIGNDGLNNGVYGKLGEGGYANACAAGGGGGYYGGASQYTSGGGGGSSFISGYEGCNAVDEQGNHTGQPLHYSGFKFTNPFMQSGDQPVEGRNATGYGKIRVTHIH